MRIGGLNNYTPVQAAQTAAPQAAAAAPRGMFNQDTFTPAPAGQQAQGGQGAAQGGQDQSGQMIKQMAQQMAQELMKPMEEAQKQGQKADQKRLAEAKERAQS